MLRKLLIISCLFSTGTIFAQEGVRPSSGVNIRQTGSASSRQMTEKTSGISAEVTDYKAIGTPLPNFMVKTIDGKIITNKDVQYNGNLLLMLFNPTCSHCENMTELLEKNIALFNKTKLLMVATPGMEPYMQEFERRHRTKEYAPIWLTNDSTKLIDRIFTYKMLPQINVYDKNRNLIKSFNGDISIDSLKEYIQ